MNISDKYTEIKQEFILLNDFEKIYIYKKTFLYIFNKINDYSDDFLVVTEIKEQDVDLIGMDDKFLPEELEKIKLSIIYLLVLHFTFANSQEEVRDIYNFINKFLKETSSYNNLMSTPQLLVVLIYNNYIYFLTSMRRHLSLNYRDNGEKRYYQKLLSTISTAIKKSTSSRPTKIQNIKHISIILELSKKIGTTT
jgi:hypothetical protein